MWTGIPNMTHSGKLGRHDLIGSQGWHEQCKYDGRRMGSMQRMGTMEYWYFVGNQRTGQCFDTVAPSQAQACSNLGWDAEDCVIIRVGHAPAAFPSIERRGPYPLRQSQRTAPHS
jgi:hypothetical protein